MRHHLPALTLACGLLWLAAPGVFAHGTDSWYLSKIVGGEETPDNQATTHFKIARADAKGGEIVLALPVGTEYTFDWSFDTDISRLQKGARFTIHGTAKGVWKAGQGNAPHMMLETSPDGVEALLRPEAGKVFGEGLSEVRGPADQAEWHVDAGDNDGDSITLAVSDHGPESFLLQVRVVGPRTTPSVIYVFQGLGRGETPPDGPIVALPVGDDDHHHGDHHGEARTTGGGCCCETPKFGSAEPCNAEHTTVQVAQRRAKRGDTVYIPLYLINAESLSNMDFDVVYDPRILEVAGDIRQGQMLEGALFKANPHDQGMVHVSFARPNGLSGTGTLSAVPFRLVGPPGAVGEVQVEVTQANRPDGAVPRIDLIYGGVLVLDEGGGLPGDGNGDGMVDEFDASLALEMAAQSREPNPRLDMDHDGRVTSRDATIILQGIRAR